MCSFVNVRHQPDLVALLSIAELVNADGIYPYCSVCVQGAYTLERSPEIVCDVEPLPVHSHRSRGIGIPPSVRDSLIERQFEKGNCKQPGLKLLMCGAREEIKKPDLLSRFF
jgi:hypothetical protein